MAKEKSGVSKALDHIENEIYQKMKPHGFKKHGRVLHRFVSGDVSQVIHFRTGQAYLDAQHWLSVWVGIRVPECQMRSFEPEAELKRYYPEHACSIRAQLGASNRKNSGAYDLRKAPEPIIEDILGRIESAVLPAFEALSSREAILERRREFPWIDSERRLILLEEAMIYGRRGDMEKANEAFNRYYRQAMEDEMGKKYPDTIRRHLLYLDELAGQLGIEILPELLLKE